MSMDKNITSLIKEKVYNEDVTSQQLEVLTGILCEELKADNPSSHRFPPAKAEICGVAHYYRR
jgi:hypothetical protein